MSKEIKQLSLKEFLETSPIPISAICKRAGISLGSLKQWQKGKYQLSKERTKIINSAIVDIGKQLIKVRLAGGTNRGRPTKSKSHE